MAKVGREKIAQALGLSPRRVSQLVREGVLIREARGEYDLGNCLVAYIRHLQNGRHFDDDPSLREERRRLLAAQADIREFELRKARGEYVPIAVYEEQMAKMIVTARMNLLNLPARLAPQLEGESRRAIRQKLMDGVRQSLTVLATKGERCKVGICPTCGQSTS